MDLYKGYKFRIYPSAEQEKRIDCTLGSCRFVYNYFLELRMKAWEENKGYINHFKVCELLTKLKTEPETNWLRKVDPVALQEAIKNLDAAYIRFFKKIANYPRFKSKNNHYQSYKTKNIGNSIYVEGKHINLPYIGRVHIHLSKRISGHIINATVSRTASGKYFVSLCAAQGKETQPNLTGGGEIGLDVGIKHFCTDTNGNIVENPQKLKSLSKKLAREQRRLSRKQYGSKNYTKARSRLARLHEKKANVRLDFQHKLSTCYIRENKTISVEHLDIKHMMKNSKFTKAIAEVSWGEFFRQLQYKAKWYGRELKKANTFYPSSQICNHCGNKNPLLKNVNVREWTCPYCHAHNLRDYNAAKNILNAVRVA